MILITEKKVTKKKMEKKIAHNFNFFSLYSYYIFSSCFTFFFTLPIFVHFFFVCVRYMLFLLIFISVLFFISCVLVHSILHQLQHHQHRRHLQTQHKIFVKSSETLDVKIHTVTQAKVIHANSKGTNTRTTRKSERPVVELECKKINSSCPHMNSVCSTEIETKSTPTFPKKIPHATETIMRILAASKHKSILIAVEKDDSGNNNNHNHNHNHNSGDNDTASGNMNPRSLLSTKRHIDVTKKGKNLNSASLKYAKKQRFMVAPSTLFPNPDTIGKLTSIPPPKSRFCMLDLHVDEYALRPLETAYEMSMYTTWLNSVDTDPRSRFGPWVPKIAMREGEIVASCDTCLLQPLALPEELTMLYWIQNFCSRMQLQRALHKYMCVKVYFKSVCMLYRYMRSSETPPVCVGELMLLAVACIGIAIKTEIDLDYTTPDLVKQIRTFYGEESPFAVMCNVNDVNTKEAFILRHLNWDVAVMPDLLDSIASIIPRYKVIDKRHVPVIAKECMSVFKRCVSVGTGFSLKDVVDMAMSSVLLRNGELESVASYTLTPCDWNDEEIRKRLDFIVKKRYGCVLRIRDSSSN